ncbi:hypothetical protein HZS_189, partial [Henneguya salminicola]
MRNMEISSQIKTADYDLVSIRKDGTIYEPSEDSFIIIDALEREFPEIKNRNPVYVLEIGVGSGVVIRSLSSVLLHSVFVCTDLNVSALKYNINQNGFNKNLFDWILADLVFKNATHACFAGGEDGNQIITRFLHDLPRYLSKPNGMCFMVCIEPNNISLLTRIIEDCSLKSTVTIKRSIGNELLSVLLIK